MSATTSSSVSGRASAKPCSPAKQTRRLASMVRRANTKTSKGMASSKRPERDPTPEQAPPLRLRIPAPSEEDTDRDGGTCTSSPGSVGFESAAESPVAQAIGDSTEGIPSSAEFRSAESSPQTEGSRARRGSEGDIFHTTSTPIPIIEPGTSPAKPRSESSLLRIRAQLRAAAAAEIECSVRQAEEPADEARDDSFMSDLSAVGGGALHDMPRLANTLLQKTKTRLEESRNLHRDIREDVISGLHGLQEMILRLADSRNRHIAEKEKQRAGYERRLAQMEAKHGASLLEVDKRHLELMAEAKLKIEHTFKEVEAVRHLVYELQDQVKKYSVGTDPTAPCPVLEMRRVQEDIAALRLDVGTLTMTLEENKVQEPRVTEQPQGAPWAQKTFATILKTPKPSTQPGPNFPLLVESADPRDTSEDVVKAIKSSVDVIGLGVGVSSIRRRKNQKVVLTCDSAEGRSKLQTALKDASQKLTVAQITTKRPLLRLPGVINDTSDAQVVEAIMRQNTGTLGEAVLLNENIKVVRRTKGRTKDISNVIIEVSPGLYKTLLDMRLRIGYQVIVAQDQSPIVQCYKCMGFGHFSKECRGEESCGHCAGSHDTRHCPRRAETPICINCSNKGEKPETCTHGAYSQSCPEWQKWDRIARSSVSYC
ncbi:uncharacterized protein LOC123877532 [Maniola jurtina]|uniref:uncharacterized protein LOC123877532 n=1 Tax=Maniola jurtina TaxID=191418 RepID=UPI001E68B16C|nr:uncharacterized protein LOC123877532 [Maniola jurtina]